MDLTLLSQCRSWFDEYVRSFRMPDPEDDRNIALKDDHTRRVCGNALRICRELGLPERETVLAEITAWFHDVGRFPQYHRYRTFRDSASVNHAALGAAVIVKSGVLSGLPKPDRAGIIHAVALHNVLLLPRRVSGLALLLAKIVRDADKLDIWRVFREYYAAGPSARPSAAGLGLPDRPGEYSPDAVLCLRSRRMVHLTQLRCLNDFTLLQLAWIYDLNWLPSLRMMAERDIISGLASSLPDREEIRAAVDELRQYVEERLAGK
jgi:hypothetical protein